MAQNRKNNYQDNEFVKNNTPFNDDLLGRKAIAVNWTQAFLTSKQSKIIAVDASWGMGKTYFARNWECKLLHDGYNVCYIDAFEYDFTDDPFMVISNSIITTLKNSNSFTELEDISNYLNILFKAFKNNTIDALPTIAEGGILTVGGFISNTFIAQGLSKITGSVVKILKDSFKDVNNGTHNPFDSINEENITYIHIVKAFKILLEKKVSEIVQDTNKPLIIMVDELDRCKPTFAIEFLEKLKHIFDVDNLVFISFVNYDELSNAVKGMYGECYDGRRYLDKFFNIKLTFPIDKNNLLFYSIFIQKEVNKNINDDFFTKDIFKSKNLLLNYDSIKTYLIDIIIFFQNLYTLSLRDIERITVVLKYIDFKDDNEKRTSIEFGVSAMYQFTILYSRIYDFPTDNFIVGQRTFKSSAGIKKYMINLMSLVESISD